MHGYASSAAIVLPLMAAYGAVGWAVTTPNNHRLTGLAPALPNVVISFNASGTYIGQAFGAIAGGLLLARDAAPATLCLAGAAIAAFALFLQIVTMRARGGEEASKC